MVEWTLESVGLLAGRLMESGQVSQGITVATAGYREGVAGRRTVQATCGEDMVTALIWNGRLESAEMLLDELRELALPEARWRHLQQELALVRGDVARSRPAGGAGSRPGVVPMTSARYESCAWPTCVTTRRAAWRWPSRSWDGWTTATPRCWPRPRRGSASTPWPWRGPPSGRGQRSLTDRATRQLERACDGLTDEWSASYFAVQLALAEAYAARVAGQPAVDQFRAAVVAGVPVRCLLRPRAAARSRRGAACDTATGTRAASSSSSAGGPPTSWARTAWRGEPSASPPAPGSRSRSRRSGRDR